MQLQNKVLTLLAASALILSACNNDEDNDNVVTPLLGPIIIECVGPVTESVTLTNDPDKQVDYRITCDYRFDSGGELIVEAGTVIEFEEGAGLVFNPGSEIHINGTETEKVILRGTEPVQGHWLAIYVASSDATNNITHAVVSDAGLYDIAGENTGIMLRKTDARLALNNVSIENIRGTGLNVETGCDISGSANVNFKDNSGIPILIDPEELSSLDNTFTFENNGENYVQGYNNSVGDATLDEDMIVNFNVLPIHLNSFIIRSNSNLKLEAGVHFKFNENGILEIQDGSLTIEGTASDSVKLSSVIGLPGGWNGIGVLTNSPLNRIDHAVITEGAGGETYIFQGEDNLANIYLEDGSTQLTLTNSLVSNSAAYGVVLNDNSSNYMPTNVSYSNNPDGDVFVINP